MKKLVLITGSSYTKDILRHQLQEYLGNLCELDTWVVDEQTLEQLPLGDVYLYSSELLHEEVTECINHYLEGEIKNLHIEEKLNSLKEIPYVIGKRSINVNNIEELFDIEKDSDVLLVNDTEKSTLNIMQQLKELGVNHCNFYPFYPGINEYKRCNIAITPGEIDKVPKEVSKVINLGSRPFDFATLIDVSRALGNEKVESISNVYLKKVVSLGNNLRVKKQETLELNEEVHKLIHKLTKYEELFNNNLTKEKEVFIKKRYYAKYTYEDIYSQNKDMEECKEISRKLAKTDLSILIEGESGTGKELFAAAIHNFSKRKDKPFLAINFSALPESLAESELFGYEEGAFTGARKGGKPGVFEQANGGTIFLDEIADAPLQIQTRLLRVLQEREIMRVGGESIIPIDIRVIAASNKRLIDLVKEGKFREDLYYRLKMGYLEIPPLRERREDISLITRSFVEKRNNKLHISKALMDTLCNLNWEGNVRELLNTLEYAVAICEDDTLETKHLPRDLNYIVKKNKQCGDSNNKQDLEIDILKAIYELEVNGELVGRKKLSSMLMEKNLEISEQKVRTILDNLCRKGLISKGRGKIGTKITEYGIKCLKLN